MISFRSSIELLSLLLLIISKFCTHSLMITESLLYNGQTMISESDVMYEFPLGYYVSSLHPGQFINRKYAHQLIIWLHRVIEKRSQSYPFPYHRVTEVKIMDQSPVKDDSVGLYIKLPSSIHTILLIACVDTQRAAYRNDPWICHRNIKKATRASYYRYTQISMLHFVHSSHDWSLVLVLMSCWIRNDTYLAG